jgi:hypothetical protein
MKNRLFWNTVKACCIFGLDKHIVVTVKGKQKTV